MALSSILDKLKLTEYAAEVMVYFEKHKLLEIVSRIFAEIALVRPIDPEMWVGKNIERIANNIYKNCLERYYKPKSAVTFYQLPAQFLPRIVIFGRPGSGCKSQATSIIRHFNVVYVDVEVLIYQYLSGTDPVSQELQRAFGDDSDGKEKAVRNVIRRRLLQMDALRKGWVLLNYPHTVSDFKFLFEEFKIPPNKLIYLQCGEQIAVRRLLNKPPLGCPQNTCPYIEQQMKHFKKHEVCIEEFMCNRFETIYIDAEPRYEMVKQNVLSQIQRTPYIMGHKP